MQAININNILFSNECLDGFNNKTITKRIIDIAIICLMADKLCASIPNVTYKTIDINLFVDNLFIKYVNEIATNNEITSNSTLKSQLKNAKIEHISMMIQYLLFLLRNKPENL